MKFSHLHVHTQYSLLDGAASIKNLYKKAIKDGMPALAISDHGNMFGVFEFVKEAYNHKNDDGTLKIKPVVGCEFYITHDRTRKTFSKDEKDPRHHQILLAKNFQGYQNLVKLTSLGYIEGMYSKYPRIDKDLIIKYNEGLIATTCCLGALVPQTIMKKGEEEAEKEFKWWLDIFGDDYYVELQRHNMQEQNQVNEVLLKFAKKYNVKVIASNDSHYVEREDFNAHDILLCVNTNSLQATPPLRDFTDDEIKGSSYRFAFPNDEFFLKTTSEMTSVFEDLPEAIDNTNEIVDKVELLSLTREILLPYFEVPKGFASQDDYLAELTWSGARQRYGVFTPEHEERISFELGVIKEMGFAGYFLIVSDFIKAGKDIGVFVGPGRGSAAGSVVAYCIGITNIDPIKYNLLFERFLNPERKSMPDIDTDFDDEGRQKVIDYVVDKYGKNQVAQIITYGTMAAKSSIADVARVMGLPVNESRDLTRLVPERPGISLKRLLHAPILKKDAGEEKSLEEKESLGPEEIENAKRLRELYNNPDVPGKVLHEAEKLEGSVRSTGVHASAIIIAPKDLTELIPIATSKDSSLWLTQIEGNSIEEAGVIKMDFLGLRTLSIIKTALWLINKNHGVSIDIDALPLDDELTYKLFQAGDTNGTFQFESVGMQKYLKELKPDKFEDLIAMNALFRPGPLTYIPSFIARKHGREAVTYDLPDMEEYLHETYGITVYQEQVMLLSQKLAGFSKGQADILRKAMGKKDRKTLDKMKGQFMEGAGAKGHPAKTLEKIWTDWEAFAQYAFNKSHATCYAFVAYQTAYLKAHYPHEYMAALLNHAASSEKITFFMEECRKMGLRVLGPDINESQSVFAVNKKGEIRFGLGGLKGVGEVAVENLIEEREKNGPYLDVFDLVKRVNQRTVNKKTLENLILSGAFDSLGDIDRAQYLHDIPGSPNYLDRIIKYGNIVQTQATTSANTLFGEMAMPEIEKPKPPAFEKWSLLEKLNKEKEVTGMYLSGHPLEDYQFELENYQFVPLKDFNAIEAAMIEGKPPQTRTMRLAGMISDASHRITKTGKPFGSFNIEDYYGAAKITLWGEDYVRFKQYLEKEQIVMVEGQFRDRFNSGRFEFQVQKMCLLDTVKQAMTRQLTVEMNVESLDTELVNFMEENISANPGNTQVRFMFWSLEDEERFILQTEGPGVRMNDDLVQFLKKKREISVSVSLTAN